jgi:hypothetical protein
MTASPLGLKFFDCFLGRKIQVDLGGSESIVAKQSLERGERNSF